MQANSGYTVSKFLTDWKSNNQYFDMLASMASLSKLFSENSVPYLDYRLAENLFCKYYSAVNDARSCTAYDARISGVGIGIKTFILDERTNESVEKIAEFNKLRQQLLPLSGIDLARQLGFFRNQRMDFSNNTFDVRETLYHIVGRKEGLLRVFNVPYDKVDVDNIVLEKDDTKSIHFHDNKNFYSFNKSKSVLQKRFVLPNDYRDVVVEILNDPLELLERISDGVQSPEFQQTAPQNNACLQPGIDFVILPLYSNQGGRHVPERSGLNQWNASGRPRNPNEVYIPIPREIHNLYPDFLPPRDERFKLMLPDNSVLDAKVCQQGSKALMSYHNKDLGEWILRKVLRKPEGSIVTIEDLDVYGFDSICLEDTHTNDADGTKIFKLSFYDGQPSYSDFIE